MASDEALFDLRDLDWSDPGVREHVALYATYGIAMHACQSLELSMARLIHLQSGLADVSTDTSDTRSDDAELELLEELFDLTAGQLAKRLDIPSDLAEDLKEAIRVRNYLAHEYLLERALDSRDLRSRWEATADLLEARDFIYSVNKRLTERSDELLRASGVPADYMDDPELQRKWSEILKEAGMWPGDP